MSNTAKEVLQHGIELCKGARNLYGTYGLVALNYAFEAPKGRRWVVQDWYEQPIYKSTDKLSLLEQARSVGYWLLRKEDPVAHPVILGYGLSCVQAQRHDPEQPQDTYVQLYSLYNAKTDLPHLRYRLVTESVTGYANDGYQDFHDLNDPEQKEDLLAEFMALEFKNLAKIDV